MKKLTIQDLQVVEVGALLIHNAADNVDHDCELIDIDANQLHGLVKYSGAPFDGESQWVPGDLLAVKPEPPPVVEPPIEAPEPEPVNPS